MRPAGTALRPVPGGPADHPAQDRGGQHGLPPLTTLFFLFLGYRLRGLAGMILAVPVGLIFIKFYEYGAFDSLINSVKELAREIEEIRHGDGKEP